MVSELNNIKSLSPSGQELLGGFVDSKAFMR